MNERPLLLKGEINLKEECIIGKVIVNKNVEDKEMYIQVLDDEHINLFDIGYKAYIFENKPSINELKDINYCYDLKYHETLIDFDVIEISNGNIKVLYRDDSNDNAIVVTNQCNSNCIMCPDSDLVRKTRENVELYKLLEQVRCIPSDAKYLTITGGEPGMLKDELHILLEECKKKLPDTEFLLLSNGRVFANIEFANKFSNSTPTNMRVGIPIYANCAEIHDSITRTNGSFKQTLAGIKNLLKRKIDIEIRIVVLKKNYKILGKISEFIVNEIPNVKMVNFMALEMLGNSYKNRNEVWINFNEVGNYLYKATVKLIKAGIITNLYNFPLCTLDERLYSIASKSITDYKVKYKDECEGCKAKDICGGFFFSTINQKDIEVKPIN